jgi:D-glycero-D-manno-heptose 1,7-bisphosphate phosphatase
MHKALFLDRDGVINHEIGYLHRPDDVLLVDGLMPLLQLAKSHGYKLIVVTNQAGIARGLYTEADFHAVMAHIRTLLAPITLDAVYFSPWHPEGTGPFRGDHPDRKPGPGMILRAAADLSLDLNQSLLIGDRCTDIAAAHAAGLPRAFLIHGTEPETPCPYPHTLIRHLSEVAQYL